MLGEACTLITGDDAMPAEHGEVIVDTGATIATIHAEHPADVLEHYWRVDVVQRWAHAIQDQRPATVRRYSLSGSQVWRPRRRHLRMIRTHGWTPWQPWHGRRFAGAGWSGGRRGGTLAWEPDVPIAAFAGGQQAAIGYTVQGGSLEAVERPSVATPGSSPGKVDLWAFVNGLLKGGDVLGAAPALHVVQRDPH